MWCRATDVRSPTSSRQRVAEPARRSRRPTAPGPGRRPARGPAAGRRAARRSGSRRGVSDVSAKDGRTAWARSVNRRTACCSGGTGQATSPVMPSASRLVASTFRSGQPCSKRLDQGGAGVDQVLAVVQDEQRSPAAQHLGEGLGQRLSGPFPDAGDRGDRSRHEIGSEIGASSTTQRPPAKMSVSSPATAKAEPGLPASSRPGEGDQSVRTDQADDLAELVLAADEAADSAGQRADAACGRTVRQAARPTGCGRPGSRLGLGWVASGIERAP